MAEVEITKSQPYHTLPQALYTVTVEPFNGGEYWPSSLRMVDGASIDLSKPSLTQKIFITEVVGCLSQFMELEGF